MPATLRSVRFLRLPSGRSLSERTCEESIPPELPPLAEGWETIENEDPTGLPYYHNAAAQVSVWDPPWQLPPDWSEFDDNGTPYYHNGQTQATVWERPWILPEGWREFADDSNTPYFNNEDTSATIWDRPFPIPPAWREYAEEGTNTPYFYHGSLDITTWDRPWPLPEGWLICRTGEGEVYYADAETNAVQWDRPRLGPFAPDATLAPAATTAAPAADGAVSVPPATVRRIVVIMAVAGASCLGVSCLITICCCCRKKKTPAAGVSEAPAQATNQFNEPKQPRFGGVNAFGMPIDATVESEPQD